MVIARRSSLLALVALGAGCTTLLGIDKDYHAPEDGGTVGSGPGGAASSGTSGGGAASGGGGNAGSSGGGGNGCIGKKGAKLIDLGAFCIDESEVTNTDYAAFLAANVPAQSVSKNPAQCTWNTSYVPSTGSPPSDTKPVTNVDWCDALAYCAWAGKHLCGKIDGGATYYDSFDNPTVDAWFATCSTNGANKYPYGATYAGTVCNGKDYGANMSINVKEAVGCTGTMAPYNQVFDLSGNVDEWEDSCSTNTGATDLCRIRGGSYVGNFNTLTCSANATSARSGHAADLGFRCCYP